MLQTYFNITVIAEWVTFIAALILLNKKTGKWRLFIPLLFLILCTETIGWYQSNILKKYDNSLPFNFLMIVSIAFFLWLMAQAAQVVKGKKYFYRAILFFIVFALINLFFFQKPFKYNSVTEVTGDILLAFFSGYLIFALLKDEQTEKSLFALEYFWFAIGILFSAMGSAVLYTFLDELEAYKKSTGINVYGYINYTVNILLYTCLIIAFL
ncbi:MAG TPA: hypothetical protein PLA68_08330, partial [Panacibacter sp.]|nr:hypothetical protein [Panacibacter sp.]